jgi:hypothetical protein
MDSMRFEVETDPVGENKDQWFGCIVVKSSGGIKRVVYTTTASHESTTKAENAAVMEFTAHLAQMVEQP